MRRKYQLTRDRVQLQNRLESLLERTHIELSSLVSDPATRQGWTLGARMRGRGFGHEEREGQAMILGSSDQALANRGCGVNDPGGSGSTLKISLCLVRVQFTALVA